MRVLHVMAGAKDGGAESIMRDAVVALGEAGVAQHVVTRADNEGRVAELRATGAEVTPADFSPLWRAPTNAAIRDAYARFKPDVAHYWMGRAGTFAPPQHRARAVGWYGGYYKLARFKNCEWHVGMTRDLEKHIIAQGVPENRASILNSYANLDPAPPTPRAELNTPEDAPATLTLARLHEKKGIDTLLEALAGLPGVHAWIAGTGPIEAELRALAEKLGVTDRAHFLGWRTDRAGLLAACDIVAFPSRYEPFGNVTIEAWAANRPLVVADAAGPAATVTNEYDALLVPKNDPEALRVALKRVIDDKALAASLVANGAKTYQEKFTKAAFVRESIALYQRMIDAAPAA